MVKEIYEKCIAEGKIVVKEEIDINKVRSLFESAINELKIAKKIETLESAESHLFKTYYDAFRELVDAFILFDKIEVSNHMCLFSYMIVKHPELELDWTTLNGMRQMRNRICYYGKSLDRCEWKQFKIKFEIYIKTLEKEVSTKIKEMD